ncbi:hypothetical protein [Hymenobacter weizhouensis]|uniref:hypothetical protein n=1 Tax=Hymenobacter sp. YIM 151500-1 TaxID=2987689 RepID=UPI002227FECE|nr:hypothetical protein [Hymenobacter sp. YIM 151500-1]UYZ64875.1 hypothetical protein OIS53_08495 [Hymenobacter sp. YIM 151500-1]
MFLLSNLTKRVTAASLLVVFLHVFVGQCLCAAIMPGARAERAAVAAPVKPKHPGCHGHTKKAATGHQAPAKQSHECCKDKSAAVLKGLTTPPVEKPAVAGPLWVALPPMQDFTFASVGAWDATQAVRLVPPQHLPPKIPDIRIFVGSLTI